MGRIVPPFRQLYQETVSDLTTELKGALIDLGHKSAFDLLLKEAWNPEVAAMGNRQKQVRKPHHSRERSVIIC